MKSTRKGFTLVELLVVIAILAILATVSVVGYTSFIDRANQSTALQEMTQIRDAVIAEDILNPNFSISGGTITVLASTDAGYDAKHPTFDAFVGALVAELGTGKNHVLAADSKSLTLNNTGKNVHATWTFATNDITTDKGTVAGGGNAGGGEGGNEGQTPVVVTLSVPSGVAAVEMGEGNVLPTANAPANYTFAGWSEVVIAETTTAPTILAAGSVYSGTATTLYAVYTRTETVEGTSEFVKVTETKSDWSGNYLIVYESGNVAFDGSLSTRDELDSENNTIAVTISNGKIAATDTLKESMFTIAKSGSNYTIKSASGSYIGRTANSNGLNVDASSALNHSSITISNGNVTITSNSGPALKFNNASNQMRFRYYASGQQNIQLYELVETQGSSTTYYSTIQ